MTAPRESEAADGVEARGMSVLRNGLAVLRTFSADEPFLGVSEVAGRLKLHKSTVSRMFAVLEEEGLVERDATTRRFRLGLGVIELAGPLLADLDVRRAAYPELRELGRRTGETAALMIWDDAEAVCVEQVESPHEVKHTTPLGARYRTALSASVQVFMAALDPSEATVLLTRSAVQLSGAGDGVEDYLTRLAGVSQRGVALNYGETSVAEVGIAAPVHDHRGGTVAAVLLSAPRFRVGEDLLPMLAQTVRSSAERVSRRLGRRLTGPAAAGAHDERLRSRAGQV